MEALSADRASRQIFVMIRDLGRFQDELNPDVHDDLITLDEIGEITDRLEDLRQYFELVSQKKEN